MRRSMRAMEVRDSKQRRDADAERATSSNASSNNCVSTNAASTRTTNDASAAANVCTDGATAGACATANYACSSADVYARWLDVCTNAASVLQCVHITSTSTATNSRATASSDDVRAVSAVPVPSLSGTLPNAVSCIILQHCQH